MSYLSDKQYENIIEASKARVEKDLADEKRRQKYGGPVKHWYNCDKCTDDVSEFKTHSHFETAS